MPPKSAALDLRSSWINLTDPSLSITSAQRLQLAGLASTSGFPICHPIRTPSSTPLLTTSARSSAKRKADRNALPPGCSHVELLTDDDELEITPVRACSAKKCAENPNCLVALGHTKWVDEEKAKLAFLKASSLEANPMERSREPGHPVGLKLGATCYAAALLQTWFQNVPFRNALYQLPTTYLGAQTKQTSPIYQLQKLFYGMQESTLSYIDPNGLMESLQVNKAEQQDAQEFSKLFMSLLASEFAKMDDERMKRLVEDQFEGHLSYFTYCKSCKYKSSRSAGFLELELTLSNKGTLEDRLEALLAKEVLDGNNKYHCSACDKLRDAERSIEINDLPPILHFSLLRFVFNPDTLSREKIKQIIRYPPSIDMSPYVTAGQTGSPHSNIYDLRGVLVHEGKSAVSGHYCADVYNARDQKWYNCDDETITQIKSLTLSFSDDAVPAASDPPLSSEPQASKPPSSAQGKFTPIPLPMTLSFKRKAIVQDIDDSDGDLVPQKRRFVPSKRSSSPTKPLSTKHHSSKDAYMLVYVRREPDQAHQTATVEPPPDVKADVEADNLQHTLDCALWALKEEVVNQTFARVQSLKMELFRNWEIESYDQPSYLVDKTALTQWVAQGITPPKKKEGSTSKPASISTPTEPPGSTTELPVPDASLESAEVFETAGITTLADLDDRVKVYEMKGRVGKRLMDLAGRTAFPPRPTLCEHGKIDPISKSKLPFKRISQDAYRILVNDFGCEIDPALEVTDSAVCEDCTLKWCSVKRYAATHSQDIAALQKTEKQSQPLYAISKAWWSEFMTSWPEMHESLRPDPSPNEDPWRNDTLCEHGNYYRSTQTQRFITLESYEYLQSLFPLFKSFTNDDRTCAECKTAEETRLADNLPDRLQAKEERNHFPGLAKSIQHNLKKDYKNHMVPMALIDSEFIKTWKRWTAKDSESDRPGQITVHDLLCEHEKLLIDLNIDADMADTGWAWLTVKDYGSFRELGYTSEDPLVCRQKENEDWEVSKETCGPCRRNRLRDFRKGKIIVRVIQPDQSADEPLPLASFKPRDFATYSRKRPVDSVVGSRHSKRQKTRRESTFGRRVTIEIKEDDTVKDIKLRIADELDTFIMFVTLSMDGKEFDDNSASIRDLDIVPGDTVQANLISPPSEDAEEAFLLSETTVADVSPRAHKRAGEHGGGFSGTVLGGGAARPVVADAKEEPSTSSGSRSKSRSISTPQDEVILASEACQDASVPCLVCTFDNAAGMTKCEICDSDL